MKKILVIFAGQAYREKTLFHLFQKDERVLCYLKDYSAKAGIDLLADDLPLSSPLWVQIILGSYQRILFKRLEPLLCSYHVDLVGYSLGEISAFLASIDASADESIQLLRYRTQLMTTDLHGELYDLLAVKGRWVFEKIATLIEQYHCHIAIINSPQHLILGGKVVDLNKLITVLQQQQLEHAKFLAIERPSHTPFYRPQVEKFKLFLQQHYAKKTLRYPIMSPLQLCKITQTKTECSLLADELQMTLQWQKVCNLIHDYQYDGVIDLGPGSAMTAILMDSGNEFAAEQWITAANYQTLAGFLKAIVAFK
jgi:[acyl-carrier-protein] S-malonyltransferase